MPDPCVGSLLPYARMGRGMRWAEWERSSEARKIRKSRRYRPPWLQVPASIARSGRFVVGQGSWSRGVPDPCAARVEAPAGQARPEMRSGGGLQRVTWQSV
ncbi:hypothetical protein J1614_007868 [Plenodomus biglobosus]|nr:hypothetical protein J1614_007868 [Plenodomus biglobosus]